MFSANIYNHFDHFYSIKLKFAILTPPISIVLDCKDVMCICSKRNHTNFADGLMRACCHLVKYPV